MPGRGIANLGLGLHLDRVEVGDHLDQRADFRLGERANAAALMDTHRHIALETGAVSAR